MIQVVGDPAVLFIPPWGVMSFLPGLLEYSLAAQEGERKHSP